eukprot:1391916-Amorphochlora_amoeboformis.AAC.1
MGARRPTPSPLCASIFRFLLCTRATPSRMFSDIMANCVVEEPHAHRDWLGSLQEGPERGRSGLKFSAINMCNGVNRFS